MSPASDDSTTGLHPGGTGAGTSTSTGTGTGTGTEPVDPEAVQSIADWVEALRVLRNRAGLSVRDIARQSGASASTIGGYVAGRHLPVPANTAVLQRMLTLFGIGEGDQQGWIDAVGRLRRLPGPRPTAARAPYLGLARYGIAEADYFCGREALTDRLVRLVVEGPGTAVVLVGASGSGKSSLLHAGLAAALVEQGWDWCSATPGPDPLAALQQLRSELDDLAPGGPAGAAARPTLVVVDQLEELWTYGCDETRWRQALDVLDELVSRPAVVVVAALRADLYGHALASESLSTALQHNQVVVGAMSVDEVVRAVTEPAARANLQLEDGLVERLLRDLAPPGNRAGGAALDAGALPLLSFALLQAWQRSGRNRLTIDDYTAAGGIAGAVTLAAEQAYTDLDASSADLVRRLFSRLVTVTDDATDTRRRLRHEELGAGLPPVVERFVQARLLTSTESTVEITHEALLTAWPRLRGWIDSDRAGLLVQQQVVTAAAEWRQAGRDPGQLLRGGRLETIHEWFQQSDHADRLTTTEHDFVVESAAARDHERRRRRVQTRRLQLLAGGLAAALVAVAGLAGYTYRVSTTAQHDRDLALSRQLAEAANRLRATDPTVAAQFALLGQATADTVEARSALLDSAAQPLARRFAGPGGLPAVAIGGHGTLLAAAADQGGVSLWRVADPTRALQPATTLPHVQKGPLYAVAVSTDGTLTAAAGGGGQVHLWDTTDPGHPAPLPDLDVAGATVLALAFDPDGSTLAATAASVADSVAAPARPTGLYLWSVHGHAVQPVPGTPLAASDKDLQAVAFSPDGRVVATAGSGGAVHRFSWDRVGAPVPVPGDLVGPTGTTTALAFGPDGRSLVAGSKDQKAYLWRLPAAAGAPVPPADGVVGATASELSGARSWVNVVAYSPDGRLLAVGGSDNHLRLYDTAGASQLLDIGHPGPITGIAFAPDGRQLFSGAADGLVRQWPVPLPVGAVPNGRVFGLGYLAPDRLVAVPSKHMMRIFDTAQPFALDPLASPVDPSSSEHPARFSGALAVAPARGLLALGDRDGTTWLYRASATDRSGVTPAGPVPHAQQIPGNEDIVQSATFIAAGQYLLSGDDGHTMQVTDVRDPDHPSLVGTPLQTKGVLYVMATSPDGRLVVTGTGSAGRVDVYDVSDPAAVHLVGTAPADGSPTLQVYGVSFTPDGRTVAVGSADDSVRMLDVSTPAAPRWVGGVVRDGTGYVNWLAFSADGRHLATASGDGDVRIYDSRTPTRLQLLSVLTTPGSQGLYSVVFDPSGSHVSAGGIPEAAYTWTIDPAQAARRVCDLVGEPVSEKEWHRYLPSVPYRNPCA